MYKQILYYLSNGQAVIYSGEHDPSQVIQRICKIGEEREIRNFIGTGSLTVIGRNEIYENSNLLDPDRLIRFWHSLILKVKRESERRRIVVIGAQTAFLQNNEMGKLIEYENKISKDELLRKIPAVCWYNDPGLFDNLSYGQVVQILNAHEATIHSGWHYRQWYADTVIEIVRNGIDRTLGQGSSKLVFKTLKLVYSLDESVVVSEPDLFEEKLTDVIGERSVDLVLEMITDTIRKEMAFSRIAEVEGS